MVMSHERAAVHLTYYVVIDKNYVVTENNF